MATEESETRFFSSFNTHMFSQALKKARKEQGLTHALAAELTGISPSMFSRYENEERKPSRHSFERLCTFFELDQGAFLSETETNSLQGQWVPAKLISSGANFVSYFDTRAFAVALRDARQEMRLTQAKAAEGTGISQPMYANFENGARKPSSKSLISICDFYKLDPKSFFSPKKDPSILGQQIIDKQREMGFSDAVMGKYLGLSARRYKSLIAVGNIRSEDQLRVCQLLDIPFDSSTRDDTPES